MKQYIQLAEWDEFVRIHPKAAEFIFMWAQQNGYVRTSTKYLPNIGELLHFLMENSNAYHKDGFIHNEFPNNVLKFDEFQLGWDGDEPIDIMWYLAQDTAKAIVKQYA